LPAAPFSATEVSRAIKRLRPSKCVGLNGIPSFIIKGFSDIFILLLTYIFNLIVTSGTFPSFWKQTAVVPVFKRVIVSVLAIIDLFIFSTIFSRAAVAQAV
jgi:hypothetical protein